jgi:hypothetical protein
MHAYLPQHMHAHAHTYEFDDARSHTETTDLNVYINTM